MPIKDLICFFYEMDAEDFELAVTAIVRERSFKRKPRKQCVRAVFKEREEKVAKQENFYNMSICIYDFC